MGSSRVRPLTALTGSAGLLSLNHDHPKFTLPNNWWFHWLVHQAPLQHIVKLLPCNIHLSRMHPPKALKIPVLVPPIITITPDLFFFFNFFLLKIFTPNSPSSLSLAVFPNPTPTPDEVVSLQCS